MNVEDTFDDLLAAPDLSAPTTPIPHMANMVSPASNNDASSTSQEQRPVNVNKGPTPPLSSQPATSQLNKSRTPTPSLSHMSTPPPTIPVTNTAQKSRVPAFPVAEMTADELAVASAEALRAKVTAHQTALREAKISAAHHELQYRMLQQESAAAIERMAVEARMAQDEMDVIYSAGQARAAATPVSQPALPDGVIPVHKHLYQRLNIELQNLQDTNKRWEREYAQQEKIIGRQEGEIASLGDKVTLLRERIRETITRSKATVNNHRLESTPRSIYSTPHRSQGLEALLQASEMANPELRPKKGGHSRNTHSLSSLPTTPHRISRTPANQRLYHTPSDRQTMVKVPATAPVHRTTASRPQGSSLHRQPILPVIPVVPHIRGPQSAATVSNSDNSDSEAETEILDPDEEENEEMQAQADGLQVSESQASLAASAMLRRSREDAAVTREGFMGGGMLENGTASGGGVGAGGLKQTRLFGQVTKGGTDGLGSSSSSSGKRKRGAEEGEEGAGRVGLGISGVGR
ncbi:hypothetical protein LTR62_001652 [Meristemomyces frigidus]|uniref:Uncharacterized protein n=1 Tax=Meristemomyces frigidus TaxID=1508187 RepID=A0AAN7YBJ3_9PEZI|nr:hypothetical protein LTR62_001652 [Meristemomyces frigidus]